MSIPRIVTPETDALIAYALAVRLDRRAYAGAAGDGSGLERQLAPRVQALLEAILAHRLPAAPRLVPEYAQKTIGRPDLAFKRDGQPARGFIELKQPSTSLEPRALRGHDRDQFRRFQELPLWAHCNFHAIRLYKRAEPQAEAVILPEAALHPQTGDQAAERLIRRHDTAPFLDILQTLATADPEKLRDAASVAAALAHAARLVGAVIGDQCRLGAPRPLADVRHEFQATLFAHAELGGFDTTDEVTLFANAFAQTLAFGMLIVREATGRDIDRDAYRSLVEGTYPLLRATLRALTEDEILPILGAAFDVLLDTINTIDPAVLQTREGRDPILYFYEDFLSVFDRDARKRHGVFFTPVPVVRFMVAATDRALRADMGKDGLLDPEVLLLDPACGTGTFLIAAASAGAAMATARYGEDAARLEVEALATRLQGLELLVGPYTVAHYRMLRELASHGARPAVQLPIYLADTLAAPAEAGGMQVTTKLGYTADAIVAERRHADELKQTTPILAIIGNPPYRRLAEGEERRLFAGWREPLWNDLKQAVSDAGWGGELNTFPELSVAFWRWCIWKLFESEGAPKKGVVCLITNRTFLAGHPYAGLRALMRRHFDTIDIIDLRGDSRGARPAGIASDENVFQIQVGVCIVVATASGAARAGEAVVRYADVWRHDAFDAKAKLELLDAAREHPSVLDMRAISGSGLDNFMPAAFAAYRWPSIVETFALRSSGVETKRDDFAYAFSVATLRDRLRRLSTLAPDEAAQLFHATPMNSVANATSREVSREEIQPAAYRPLDRRMTLRASRFIDRPRPALGFAWGEQNVCLFSLPAGTGEGPAIWCHGSIPDRHAFRGSYGGYAFPLRDRRRGADAHNLSPALAEHLAALYGPVATPQTIFDAIAALLSATSYTSRFAWDLEEAFPHIPFPSDAATFAEAARIGAEIRALETGGPIEARFQIARVAGRPAATTLDVPRLRDFFVPGEAA